MLAIIGAMSVEVDAIKELVENKKIEKISGVEFVSGKLGGKDVVVAECGIGKVNAAICTQTMILKYAPDEVINVGVGGSLSNELDIGNIALASAVVQADCDTTALGDPIGLISTINVIELKSSEKMLARLENAADALSLTHKRGTISTSDAFIASAEKKDFLTKTFGAIACEMEGGSIAHVCYVNGVDFAVVRAISDKADGSSHMDYPQFCAMAAKNSAALICEYVKDI